MCHDVLQGCNTEAVRTLLGGEDLSDANMLAHLGIIEQRSNELLQVRVQHCNMGIQQSLTDLWCDVEVAAQLAKQCSRCSRSGSVQYSCPATSVNIGC